MITASFISDDYVSNVGTYAAYAEARYGANGDFYGDPELIAANGSDYSTGRTCWDSMSSWDEGFDSDWTVSQLWVDSSGDVTWDVNGSDDTETATTGLGYDHIQAVDIRSMTSVAGAVQWRNLTVTFYKAGVVTDQYTAGAGPSVDTSTASSPFAEQTLHVASSRTDNDMVVVSGQFRLSHVPGVYPSSSDLAAQIFVYNTGS
jgi:hypothetical protein